MAGRNFTSRSYFFTLPSSVLIATLALLALASILFFFLSSSGCLAGDSPTYTPLASTLIFSQNPNPNPPPPEYSFVASLEKFLASRSSKASPPPDTAARDGGEAAARVLDDAIWRRETDAWAGLSVVRVYVYEMPAKFTYDLLRIFLNTYQDTANLTSNGSPVHRLIEQHSIDYWLWSDLIAPQSERLLKNVIRVHQQEEADLFYIPFFTTISYFLLERQQCKALYRVWKLAQAAGGAEAVATEEQQLQEQIVENYKIKEALKWVTDQPAWQRSEGRDHILPVHHPWSFKSVRRYMKKAIWILPDMDSTGNWYKPGQVWLEKDLILPYVPNVDFCDTQCLHETHSKRSTLLFFRGRLKRNAGGKVRSKLVEILQDTEGVIMEEGTVGVAGKDAAQNGMRKSLFCLSPAGDTPSSARLFDAIASGCIPVIVSDELELPFEGLLDYRKIAFFISSSDAVQPGWLVNFLKSISPRQINEMQENLEKHSRHFLYSSPAQPFGAEDFTWRMIAGKLLNIKLHIRRSQRMVKGSRSLCTCECRPANITFVP